MLRSCWTAVLDARSPRAAPPTPSQTASSQGPAYPLSWLSLRTRPTSEMAAKRSSSVTGAHRRGCVVPSLAQLQDRLADADLRAEGERRGLGDPHRADVGAVGGAQVLDEPLVPARGDPGVAGGDVVVVEPDGRVAAAADQDGRLRQVGALARVGPVHDQHVGGDAAAGAALRLLAGLRLGGGGPGTRA